MTPVTPYNDSRPKSEQVEQMFDSIAPAYDLMNTAMTFGLHNVWRSKALKAAAKALETANKADSAPDGSDVAPLRILDIATGTGDVAFELHRRHPGAEIIGVDLSEGMLDVARRKLADADEQSRRKIRFEQGDSLALRFGDAEFDMITVAYGVRNFQQLDRGLAEMRRVLRPGGVLCIIELSEPRTSATRAMYRLYARHLIPLVGRLVSGDSRAYSYLPESIAAAPQRQAMCALMREAGFTDCRWRSLTLGAVTYYIATAP